MKKTWKKRLSAVLAMVMLVSLLVSSFAFAEDKIEIRLLTPWTVGSAAYGQIEALLATWAVEHPNVSITHDALPTGDARTKLTVEMAAGNPPDVSWCPLSYAREFIKDDMIIDWSGVFADPRYPEFKQWFSEKSLTFASTLDGKIDRKSVV